ncbi:fimbria/pilus periplasmic chaperone [Serratia fonticola]|uniref:Fimbria/pilus periplasmic chaperone n=1 Tax=Serratia fonticola TaxID=47917 RepID=A0AAJ1YF89_SERFO|nr:fimbria/pilus periplasmic chaperone [Serratia fonticola]MDQ9128877.1 fimbria/pilus periplasmic chaperone [Serratia fonticola]
MAALYGFTTQYRRLGRWLVIMVMALFIPQSHAEIYLGATRLIVNGKDKEATLRVTNEGRSAVLLQVWVDNGDSEAEPEKIATPFTVSPPILRLDGKRAQRLRVLFTGAEHTLPSDRESVFWLNVLEIPPKVANTASQMQMAFRTRIKLFYRPRSLQTVNTTNVQEQLRFSLAKQGGNPVLVVGNPTPFHQTLLEMTVGRDKQQAVATLVPENGMVSPKGQADFALTATKGPVSAGMKVFYSVLDDFGSVVTAEQVLQAAQSSSPR